MGVWARASARRLVPLQIGTIGLAIISKELLNLWQTPRGPFVLFGEDKSAPLCRDEYFIEGVVRGGSIAFTLPSSTDRYIIIRSRNLVSAGLEADEEIATAK